MAEQRRKDLLDEHRPENIARRLQQQPKSQKVSDFVLGAIDGCVTTFAVVSGAFGAGFSPLVVLVLGFANLIADGFSMAVSNYEAVNAEREYRELARRTEERHIELVPEGEREEIRQIFANKGFGGETLEKIVATITANRQLWVETMLTEEYGLNSTRYSPVTSALVTFAAFIAVGAIPLLPFLMPFLAQQTQFVASTVLAALMFLCIGMLKSLVYSQPILRAGFSTLLLGGGAASLAYVTGYLLRQLFGIDAA
ncbi:Predicted Fe2+/Mn2+ transporter, VIT1/CCC1 family [Microbulbifer donghaiensis]|uniref:Predicted Fe2+/Mn2+ transporter, VIT1/CCC1 family n=1 Tax=Microbulbifer donghaiensis TaxID=494016 RepID=A0A1M5A611_9GAMM|nr:VIT1/CCC1 transporter family protein [Microbulbifer donghaiensis]SHF25731.1 Predicted Fe2+/Mn2+ transporter, VIT1/CCC1 family [Microbulbifer donghaiensis]